MDVWPVAALSRSGAGARVLAQRLDLTRSLGVRPALRHRTDKVDARRWAPAARRAVYDAIWAEAASAVGAAHERLGDDFTVLRRGDRRTVAHFHNVQLDDAVTLRLALDKALVHRLLRAEGLTVPEHRRFTPAEPGEGLAMLTEEEPPFVVKPASGTSGGAGVTCAVDSVDDFRRATLHASRLGEGLMIERHVHGEEYRFLFLDGVLLDVIRRRPPRVVGDGRSTIAELVSAENAHRRAGAGRHGISVLEIDLDAVLTLDRAGLSTRSVVAAGVPTPVKSAANANAPTDNVTVDRADVCDELVEEARRAAGVVPLRFAGVDLITPDVTRALGPAGGAIVEVNGTPGLHYHYLVADPDHATRVAVPVLRTLLDEAPRAG